MDEQITYQEQFETLMEKITKIEQERNKLFNKALHIYMYTVIAICCILSLAQIILFLNMFER